MGLDTYALAPEAPSFENEDERRQHLPDHLFSHIPPVLCGGLFSGHGGCSSFRGKVYDDFVTYVTDETLYQEEIPNLTVHKMVAAMQEFIDDNPSQKTLDKLDITRAEVEALLQWLKVVADNNGSIGGWW